MTNALIRRECDDLYAVRIGSKLRMNRLALTIAFNKIPYRERRKYTSYSWAGERYIDGERWGLIQVGRRPLP